MNFLLHRKIAICMLFIALTGLGYVSYKQLPVELLPNAELPMLFVQVTSAQDMDPSYVESEVVIPIEGAIGTIGGVEQIESLIDSRQSSIKIDFKSNINFKITALKLQEKINEIASSLPEGFTVQVQKIDVSMLAGGFMSLQVSRSRCTPNHKKKKEKEIRPDLENIDGIASVNIYGGREKAIEVQLDPDACKALNLTPSAISSLLTQNTQEKAFVGREILCPCQFSLYRSFRPRKHRRCLWPRVAERRCHRFLRHERGDKLQSGQWQRCRFRFPAC